MKIACEPLHAQMNLPDYSLAVVNTTRDDRNGLQLRSRIVSLDNLMLADETVRVDAPKNSTTTLAPLNGFAAALASEGTVLVKLTLTAENRDPMSDNTYWQAITPDRQRSLDALHPASIKFSAWGKESSDDEIITARVLNAGRSPLLNAKLTALDGSSNRVLPVYYSDNYVSLLPGETREMTITRPHTSEHCARLALRGWNLPTREISVSVGHHDEHPLQRIGERSLDSPRYLVEAKFKDYTYRFFTNHLKELLPNPEKY